MLEGPAVLIVFHSQSQSFLLAPRSDMSSRSLSPSRPPTSAEVEAVIAAATANAPPPPPSLPDVVQDSESSLTLYRTS